MKACIGSITQRSTSGSNVVNITMVAVSHAKNAIANGISSTMSSMDKSDITSVLSALASNKDINVKKGSPLLLIIIMIVVAVVVIIIVAVTAKLLFGFFKHRHDMATLNAPSSSDQVPIEDMGAAVEGAEVP